MSGSDVFARLAGDFEGLPDAESDAVLGARLHLHLRGEFDARAGCWPGRDEHDTLRRTAHAVEVLHRLDLDADTAAMVRTGGNWLINLPGCDALPHAERARIRLYPSRFKTLAYLRRFDDDLLRRDFLELLGLELGGMVRGVTESDVLTTCIVLDTLLTLERAGRRFELCPDERYERVIVALRRQLSRWRPETAPTTARGATRRGAPSHPMPRRAAVTAGEIRNTRDLSYTLGLLLHADRPNLAPRAVLNAMQALVAAASALDHGGDLPQTLYAALQLAEHFRGDETVQAMLQRLLHGLRDTYATPDAPRRWDLSYHTLVLRLLLTHHGDAAFSRQVVACYLREAERQQAAERSSLEDELKPVLRERIELQFGEIVELTGGYTDDRIYRVPFAYWYALPDHDAAWRPGHHGRLEASVIIKRSTSDAFSRATSNYQQLPPALRRFFVRQPEASQVRTSGANDGIGTASNGTAYYLTMEDLAEMETFEQLMNGFDQRAMADQHARLIRAAADRIAETVSALFRETQRGPSDFPGTQVARLYLASIDGKLARAIQRAPWLKTPLEGCAVGEARYRPFEQYLASITRHMADLQPRALGLTHGDLHPRNIMMDTACTHLKLIDLDKLTWMGDYAADLGNLLADVCIFRRLATPEREFGLRADQITFARNAEGTLLDNTFAYPAIGRPATVLWQQHLLERAAAFADQLDDRTWRPRLWLAAATALVTRLTFVAEKHIAAVLYAEAVRLLSELARFLESGTPLPALPVPEARPQGTPRAAAGELPDWISGQPLAQALHDSLRRLGLRPETDRATVTYYLPAPAEGALLRLILPRRGEGIARLLLPSGAETAEAELEGLHVVRSGQENDAFGTIVIVNVDSDPTMLLAVARQAMEAATVRVR
ncbi:MAG TPA: phosphotransferase [Ktedonobacterales bacterium]|nr:phosphotransferase [Ktedonobacterales bacterium]